MTLISAFIFTCSPCMCVPVSKFPISIRTRGMSVHSSMISFNFTTSATTFFFFFFPTLFLNKLYIPRDLGLGFQYMNLRKKQFNHNLPSWISRHQEHLNLGGPSQAQDSLSPSTAWMHRSVPALGTTSRVGQTVQ